MAIKGHDSKEVTIKSIDKFTGLCTMKVVAINPSVDKIRAILGLDDSVDVKEPIYKDLDLNKDGNLSNKIVVYLQDKEALVLQPNKTTKVQSINARLEFIVSPKEYLSKEGKNQIINRVGLSSFLPIEQVEASENSKWFNKPPFHNALVGEEFLLKFVREWQNLASDDDCNFEDVNALMSGDVTELEALRISNPNNSVVVLLGVANNYQTVYNKCFSRPTYKTPTVLFNKVVNEQYSKFKADWGNDYTLKVYSPKAVANDSPDVEKGAEAASAWS